MSDIEQTALPDGRKVWMVTGYDAARAVLNDSRFSSDTDKMGDKAPLAALPPLVKVVIASDMMNNDPPEHTRLRRIVAPTFTVRRIAEYKPHVERIANELLDAFGDRNEVDLVADFAGPLATRVLGELIGMAPEDAPQIRRWSDTFVMDLLSLSAELLEHTKHLSEYAASLVERRRAEPTDDMVTRLVSLRESADRLSDNELSSMIFILMIAGQTATAQMLAKGLRLLLTHPDQLAEIRRDPALLPGAAGEVMRIDPPLQVSAFRMATEPVEISGVTVPAGDIVICSLYAMNHDDRRFTDPDRFDIHRRDSQHAAFGHGLHRCLGANLAELQAQVGLAAFVERYDAVVLDDGVSWRQTALMNVLTELPARLTRR